LGIINNISEPFSESCVATSCIDFIKAVAVSSKMMEMARTV